MRCGPATKSCSASAPGSSRVTKVAGSMSSAGAAKTGCAELIGRLSQGVSVCRLRRDAVSTSQVAMIGRVMAVAVDASPSASLGKIDFANSGAARLAALTSCSTSTPLSRPSRSIAPAASTSRLAAATMLIAGRSRAKNPPPSSAPSEAAMTVVTPKLWSAASRSASSAVQRRSRARPSGKAWRSRRRRGTTSESSSTVRYALVSGATPSAITLSEDALAPRWNSSLSGSIPGSGTRSPRSGNSASPTVAAIRHDSGHPDASTVRRLPKIATLGGALAAYQAREMPCDLVRDYAARLQ